MARGKGEGTISQQPDGKWCARITVGYDADGKQKRKAFYGKTRKEVLQKLTAAQNEVNKGVYVEPSKMTVGVWIDTWLEEYKKRTLKPSAYSRLYCCAHGYVIPALGEYKLKDLRPEHVQKFINSLSDKGLALSTIRNISNPLYGALEQAVKNELVAKNVSGQTNFPKAQKTEMRVLSQDEQAQFVLEAKNTVTGRAFILTLYTGLRLGELLALTWDDVGFENGVLSVNKSVTEYKEPKPDGAGYAFKRSVGTPKTKASIRAIPLLPNILEMLSEEKESCIPSANNLVFPDYNGDYIWQGTARSRLRSILKKANVNNANTLHPHSLRHTFATRGLEKGIPMKVMQELLGHASIKMTADLYTHVLPETKQNEIMKLADTIKLTPPISSEQPDAATQQ